MKVRYIGYGEDYDEWRLLEDIVELNDVINDSSSGDEEAEVVTSTTAVQVGKFCLYEELAYRIKSYRTPQEQGILYARLDVVYFEGLIRRGTQV